MLIDLPSWALLFTYTPAAVMVAFFIGLPFVAGGCYALVQLNKHPNTYLHSDDNLIEAERKTRRMLIGKESRNLSFGVFFVSMLINMYIFLICNSSIPQNQYHEITSYLSSDQIYVSGDLYTVPTNIKDQRQALYEGYVADSQLTKIEFLKLNSQVATLMEDYISSHAKLPETGITTTVLYRAVDEKKNLTL